LVRCWPVWMAQKRSRNQVRAVSGSRSLDEQSSIMQTQNEIDYLQDQLQSCCSVIGEEFNHEKAPLDAKSLRSVYAAHERQGRKLWAYCSDGRSKQLYELSDLGPTINCGPKIFTLFTSSMMSLLLVLIKRMPTSSWLSFLLQGAKFRLYFRFSWPR